MPAINAAAAAGAGGELLGQAVPGDCPEVELGFQVFQVQGKVQDRGITGGFGGGGACICGGRGGCEEGSSSEAGPGEPQDSGHHDLIDESRGLGFDLVFEDEAAAGVAGFGAVEVLAEFGSGRCLGSGG